MKDFPQTALSPLPKAKEELKQKEFEKLKEKVKGLKNIVEYSDRIQLRSLKFLEKKLKNLTNTLKESEDAIKSKSEVHFFIYKNE